MIYLRKLQVKLVPFLQTPEIIILTGMRRVGKTTLYRALFDMLEVKNKVFLDLENPVVQKIFEEKDYNNVVGNLREFGITPGEKAFIFLDEIKSMPEISRVVKFLYDHYGFKFFLTGSSSYYLKNLFPESLAGRKFVFELYPLDFEEFLIFKGQGREFKKTLAEKAAFKNNIRAELLKGLYDEYLQFGGFPQVVLEADPAKKRLHIEDIFKSYFEKDVRGLAKFREIQLFRDLLLLLMDRVGSKLDVSRLASELGTSRETVYSYLAFLEGTFFISLVQPFTGSADKLVSKARKVYFCDTGILNVFSKISSGAIFENAVYNNLRASGQINYYQKQSSTKEIDFVVNAAAGIEVKLKGVKRDILQLKAMAQKINLKEGYVVTREFANAEGFIPAVEL